MGLIRLENAVIHPYKCFEADQSFQVRKDITALMGRNEAGKTSVLEAMAKTNYIDSQNENFVYDAVYDYPRRKKKELDKLSEVPPAVTLTYQVDAELADEIEQDIMLSPAGKSFSRCINYKGRHHVEEKGFEYSVKSFLEVYAQRKGVFLEKFIKPLSSVQNIREFGRLLNYVGKNGTQEEKDTLEELAPYFENKHGWGNLINGYYSQFI